MKNLNPTSIRIYTDGSYYPSKSALGSAWIKVAPDNQETRKGYCIKSPENNNGGSLLAEIMAVSQSLKQLTEDVGASIVTIVTDCKDVELTINQRNFDDKAKRAKRDIISKAWANLGREVSKHHVEALWRRDSEEPLLREAHHLAQSSAMFAHTEDKGMICHEDIEHLTIQ
ncbi:MAG: ribonuclease HI [Alphaproteobacteria bacterium]